MGQSDGKISLWRFDNYSGELNDARSYFGHRGPINALVFSNKGDKLVSGSSDKSILIWDLLNPGKEPMTLLDHGSWVWSLAIAPAGDTIVSGSQDRTARVWPVRTKDLANRVCDLVSRNLSQNEWNEFIGQDIDYELTCDNLPAGEGSRPKLSATSR